MNTQELFEKVVASTIADFGQDHELKLTKKVFQDMPQPMFEVKEDEEFITIKLLN